MKYGKLNLGQIEAIVNKLGGMYGVERFLSGQTVVQMAEQPNFQIWKTIKLGTGLKDADDFRKALKDGGYRIGDWANDILGQSDFTVSDTEKEVDLVNVSAVDLGFEDRATRKDIYCRALELGLKLCPAEVGPQLRLQYLDQRSCECIRVAMEPITGSDGDSYGFYVVHDYGERCLDSNSSSIGFWDIGVRWLFLRSK